MTKTIALVQCVKTKQEISMPARKLYCSDWFKKASAYADKISDEWYILSAKYGLLPTEKVISPYDITCKDMKKAEREAWAKKVLIDLRCVLVKGNHVVILAGESYREHLIDPIRQMGCEVEIPMEGLGFGKQKRWLENMLLDP